VHAHLADLRAEVEDLPNDERERWLRDLASDWRGARLSPQELERGYRWAYDQFYAWPSIIRAATSHKAVRGSVKHLLTAGGWKKLEPFWNLVIRTGQLQAMRPVLEAVLSGQAKLGPSAKATAEDRRGNSCEATV